MIKRTTIISTRWDFNILDDVEKLVKSPLNPDGTFKNVSEAIRETTKAGIKLYNYQEMMKDPKKSAEFTKKMQEMLQAEKIFDFAQTLSSDQLDGFLMALKMEKESRYQVQKLA